MYLVRSAWTPGKVAPILKLIQLVNSLLSGGQKCFGGHNVQMGLPRRGSPGYKFSWVRRRSPRVE